ncbi:DUF86 domain-containing protein [Sphingobacteriales bacterium CHB3]|nr:DUF86 domain-containing protein [Sphingobacteriales bacterium CHB3]
MSRDIGLYIDDILESMDKIQAYIETVGEDEFYSDSEKQDAVLRRMLVIGEATKNIPAEFRTKYPDVPWQKMAGLRDIIVHQYFGVTLGLIWRVANSDLPLLRERILEIKAAENL